MWTTIAGLFKSALGWVSASASKLWLYGGIVAATVGVILFAWLRARSDGANSERVRQAEQAQKNLQERRNVEDNIRRTGDDAVAERLRKWQRD